MNTTRKRLVIAGSALGVLVVGAIVAWLLFSGNAPDEATLADAVDVVVSDREGDSAGSGTTEAPVVTTEGVTTTTTDDGSGDEPIRVDGTWSVDTTIGQFSFQDATSSFAGFRVAEELSGIGAVDAVGRTPDVAGTITLEGTTLVAGSFTADLSTLTTDRSRRDSAVRRALAVTEFPTATFEISEPIDFGSIPDGETAISVSAEGDLTVKGVTNRATIDLEAQLVDDVIVVVGQIPVVFADFGVAVPSAAIVLRAEDHGIIEVQLFFTR